MRGGTFTIGLAVAVLSIAVTGCTGQMVSTATGPMPDYCTGNVNNTAGGAVLGSLLGAAIGAAAGGGRGAAFGALAGAAAGGLTGSQMDANCRQYAMQNFMQMMAQQAATRRAAMTQGAGPQLPPSEYQNFEYYAPSSGEGQAPMRRRLSQTSGYTDPATKETCNAYSEFSFGADGSSRVTGTGRICTGADGKPHPA